MYSLTITNKPESNKVINTLGSSVKMFLSDPIELDLKKEIPNESVKCSYCFL